MNFWHFVSLTDFSPWLYHFSCHWFNFDQNIYLVHKRIRYKLFCAAFSRGGGPRVTEQQEMTSQLPFTRCWIGKNLRASTLLNPALILIENSDVFYVAMLHPMVTQVFGVIKTALSQTTKKLTRHTWMARPFTSISSQHSLLIISRK